MELDATLDDFSVIRVAVLAMGQMPPVYLRDYVETIVKHTDMDLRSVRAFYIEHQKSPFTQLAWETGKLRIKFMVGGAVRNPWEDFQAHRKIHGVIGLCHCPLSHDLGATYDKFLTICASYPSAQVKRCFGFHASDNQLKQEDKSKNSDFILFPSADYETLELHIKALMQAFAAAMLMDFERRVLLGDPVASSLTTPLDLPASTGSEEVSKAKKKRLGRLQKAIGDYCLLSGSHLNASAHYLSATEVLKSTGDVFWHAGAAEGSISAIMVDRQRDQQFYDDVKTHYAEIIQLYKSMFIVRGTFLAFELEANLKLAKLLSRKESTKDAIDILTNCIESGKSLLEPNDRLVLFVEVARIYGFLGYERKAAFYSREVAHLYLQQDNHWAALSALQILHSLSSTYCPSNSAHKVIRGINSRVHRTNDAPWSSLQIDVLANMLAASIRGGDALAAWCAASQLLRAHYPLITPHAQISLATALSTAAAKLPGGTRSSVPALPFLRWHSFPQESSQMDFIKRKPGKKEWWTESSSSGPFIYTPFSGRHKEPKKIQLVWIVGEPVEVLVEVANPCAFEIHVESICLSVEPGEFEAFPLSFVLPPNGSDVLSLSGRPLSTGSLTVRGCFVNYNGVVTEHCFGGTDAERGLFLADPFRSSGRSGLKLRNKPLPDIKVIPPLPSLVVDVVGGEGVVVLYEGEVRNMTIDLCNVGSVPVIEANVTMVARRREQHVYVEDDVLQAALPLHTGRKASVPIQLQIGHLDSQSERKTLENSTQSLDEEAFLHIHYAGNVRSSPTLESTDEELSPGRRLTSRLRLRVLQGLRLVNSRLLSMEIPLQLSSTLPADTRKAEANAAVRMDPYRGGWNLRVLELELWNGTDAFFEVTVAVKGEELDASTKVDRKHCARVLVPLEKFKLPALGDKAFFATARALEHRSRNEVTSTIEELCSSIRVRWSSGKNTSGELHLKDAIRDALRDSVREILLPDPLTFAFRLAAGEDVRANQLVPIEMLVKNNTAEDVAVSLSVACRDISGASCVVEQQILYAGALDGVEVELSSLGEAVHRFSLFFLVPGEYTLLGAAVVSLRDDSICYCGPPFAVHVA
ncbi:hypothetical protein SELMODRAFT_77626 [Selaginella moellendorffii]|uniref:Uncharacterized protein n=1 Tax=Selaginella moellendorffii TaxID=88036 RepID=D8QSM8_SELML|nr:hypothetical protein SELMODRAFT_77626 [Selaginella moellendorffii]